MAYGVPDSTTDATPRAGVLSPAVNALSNAVDDLDLRVTSTTSVANEAHSWAETANNRNDSQDSALDAIRNRLDNVEEASAVPGPMGQTGPPGQDGIDGSDGQDGVVSSIVDGNDVDQTSPTLKFTGAEVTSNGIVTTVAIDGGGHIIVDENGNDVPQQPRLGFSGNAAPGVLNVGDTTFLVFTAPEAPEVDTSELGKTIIRHDVGQWRTHDSAGSGVPSATESLLGSSPLAYPLQVDETTTYDALLVNVSNLNTQNVVLGIYFVGANGPTTLLATASVSATTTGLKTALLSSALTLQPGLYAIAVMGSNLNGASLTSYTNPVPHPAIHMVSSVAASTNSLRGFSAWAGSTSVSGVLDTTWNPHTDGGVRLASAGGHAISIRRSA